MLALACDQRVMVTGKARIALNEIGFGASLLAGSDRDAALCGGKFQCHAGPLFRSLVSRRGGTGIGVGGSSRT